MSESYPTDVSPPPDVIDQVVTTSDNDSNTVTTYIPLKDSVLLNKHLPPPIDTSCPASMPLPESPTLLLNNSSRATSLGSPPSSPITRHSPPRSSLPLPSSPTTTIRGPNSSTSLDQTSVPPSFEQGHNRRRSAADNIRNPNRFSGFFSNLIHRRPDNVSTSARPSTRHGRDTSPSSNNHNSLKPQLSRPSSSSSSINRPSTPPPSLPPPTLQELGLSLTQITAPIKISHTNTPPANGAFLSPHYLLLCHSQGLDVLPLVSPPAPQPYALVRRVSFKSVVVMEERGVLVAIAGRRDGVRVYALEEVKKAVEWRVEVEIRREKEKMRKKEKDDGGANGKKLILTGGGQVDKVFADLTPAVSDSTKVKSTNNVPKKMIPASPTTTPIKKRAGKTPPSTPSGGRTNDSSSIPPVPSTRPRTPSTRRPRTPKGLPSGNPPTVTMTEPPPAYSSSPDATAAEVTETELVEAETTCSSVPVRVPPQHPHSTISIIDNRARSTSVTDVLAGSNDRRRSAISMHNNAVVEVVSGDTKGKEKAQQDEEKVDGDEWMDGDGSSDEEAINLVSAGASGSAALDERTSAMAAASVAAATVVVSPTIAANEHGQIVQIDQGDAGTSSSLTPQDNNSSNGMTTVTRGTLTLASRSQTSTSLSTVMNTRRNRPAHLDLSRASTSIGGAAATGGGGVSGVDTSVEASGSGSGSNGSRPPPSPTPTLWTLRQALTSGPPSAMVPRSALSSGGILGIGPGDDDDDDFDADEDDVDVDELDLEEETRPANVGNGNNSNTNSNVRGERRQRSEPISFLDVLRESRLPDLPPPGSRRPQQPILLLNGNTAGAGHRATASHSVVSGDDADTDDIPGSPRESVSEATHSQSYNTQSSNRSTGSGQRQGQRRGRRWSILETFFTSSPTNITPNTPTASTSTTSVQTQNSRQNFLHVPIGALAHVSASASATMSNTPISRDRERLMPQTVPENSALALTRSQSNVIARPARPSTTGSGAGSGSGGARGQGSARRPSSSQGVRRTTSTAGVNSLVEPPSPMPPPPPPPSASTPQANLVSSGVANNSTATSSTSIISNTNANNGNNSAQYRFLPRIITNALNSRRSEDFGGNVARTPVGEHGSAASGHNGNTKRVTVSNQPAPAPKLEYVKLPGTKGSILIKAVETSKKSFLAILCGEAGEKVELFAGTYRTTLGLSRTFILPDSPRSLELQLQGDDLVEVFLVFAQNVFGLEPATVRVREVRIGRAERRAARRRARENNRSGGGTGTGLDDQVGVETDGPLLGDEETNVNVNVSVGVELSTSQSSTGPLPNGQQFNDGEAASSADPNAPTNLKESEELAALAAAQAGPYTTFQQLSFAPPFPLASIADECIIPPSYPSFLEYRAEHEPEAAGLNNLDLASIQFSPPGLPAPPAGPPSRWLYRDPKGVVQGPWKASLMQSWYKDGLLPPDLPIRREEDTEYVLLKDLRLQCVDPTHPFRPPPPPLHTPSVLFPESVKPLLSPISLLTLPRRYGPPALFFSSRGGHSTAIVDTRGRSVLKGRFLWTQDDEIDINNGSSSRLGDIRRLEAFEVQGRAAIAAVRQGGIEVVDIADALLKPADDSRYILPNFNPPQTNIGRRRQFVWRIGSSLSPQPVGSASALPSKNGNLPSKKSSLGLGKSPAKIDTPPIVGDDGEYRVQDELMFLGRHEDQVYFCERTAHTFRVIRLSPNPHLPTRTHDV